MSGFIGSGKIKIALYSSGSTFGGRAYVDVGNASKFAYSFSEAKQELRDYQDPAGGTADAVTRIDKVEGSIDLRDFKVENLALALWGTTAALAATAITGEAHVLKVGKFVPAERIINTTVPPVIKKGSTTILAADYTVSAGGITFKSTISTAGVVDGDAITFDYTPEAGADVQALITTAPEVSIFFEGVNLVTGKNATARIYKAKLGVAQGVDQISDDFGTLPITFTVSKDSTVVGAGLSKFLALQQSS